MARGSVLRRAAGLVAAAGLALTLAACSPGVAEVEQPPQVDSALADDTQAQLTTAVERAMAGTGSTAAIVGVWAPWAGTWVQGFGTNPDGSAIDADATFKAGTVTRAMTCDVLAGLAADGVVDIDDPLSAWLDGIPSADDVTLGQLCDGTSGYGAYQPHVQGRWEVVPTRVWNPRELVSYGLGSASTPAGTYTGSDTGYVLLGLALEQASSRSAAELFDQYVFEPLEMTSSSLPNGSRDLGLHGIQSAVNAEGAVDCAAETALDLTNLSLSAGFTSAGVVTNVDDLGRYTRALATGLRSYDDPARFEAPIPVAEGVPTWYTVDGGTYQAGSLIGQYGSVPGYQTVAFADRASGLTVVAVLNNSRAPAEAVRVLGWQLAAIASKAPAAEGEAAPEAGLPWTAEQMDADLASVAVCPLP